DPDLHRRVERVPARHDADVVASGAHRAGGDRVLHGLDGVRGPAGHDQRGLGGDLDTADRPGPAVPEADRRGPDRRRRQGVVPAEEVPGLEEVLSPDGWPNASSASVGEGDPGRYNCLFGRDSLITSLAVLPARPDVAAA